MNKEDRSKNFLAKLNENDLKELKVSIQQNVKGPAPRASVPLQRSLDDPSTLVLHREDEGKRPIFSGIMEERTIQRSQISSRPNSTERKLLPKNTEEYAIRNDEIDLRSDRNRQSSSIPSTSKCDPSGENCYHRRNQKGCTCFGCPLNCRKFSSKSESCYASQKKSTFSSSSSTNQHKVLSYSKTYSHSQKRNSNARSKSRYSTNRHKKRSSYQESGSRSNTYDPESYYRSDSRSSNECSDYSESSSKYSQEELDDYYYHCYYFGSEDYFVPEYYLWPEHAFVPYVAYLDPQTDEEMPLQLYNTGIEERSTQEVMDGPDSTEPDL